VLSFNDEGFLEREAAEALLAARGTLTVIEREHPRYVGARIGIYNPAGQKVGRVGRLRNKEFLYVVGPERVLTEQAAAPSISGRGRRT
jgi:adenine-specific DNA-methyltransferase